jgi:dihydrofolate reductase
VQYLNAGLVDEFTLTVSPVFFGEGVRLFERIDRRAVRLEPVAALPSPRVTHLRYTVHKR